MAKKRARKRATPKKKATKRKNATPKKATRKITKKAATPIRKAAKKKAAPKPRITAKAGGLATAAAPPRAALVDVTMTIDFGPSPPGDVMSIRRIDSKALAVGKASVNPGSHTAGWDVVSPTIRPIGFGVKITEDQTGRTLLNRPQEQTGADGRGAGADRFTV
jgi:hypothetical protein